jgi:hypothetical protein
MPLRRLVARGACVLGVRDVSATVSFAALHFAAHESPAFRNQWRRSSETGTAVEGLQALVYLDGVHVATLDGAHGLKQGWSAQLEDGAQVEIRSIRRVLFPELSVLRNGQHVQSSPSHPDKMLRSSSNAMIILSVFLLGGAVMSGGQGYAWLDVLFSLLYFIGASEERSPTGCRGDCTAIVHSSGHPIARTVAAAGRPDVAH